VTTSGAVTWTATSNGKYYFKVWRSCSGGKEPLLVVSLLGLGEAVAVCAGEHAAPRAASTRSSCS
jgi:hypothetical protein